MVLVKNFGTCGCGLLMVKYVDGCCWLISYDKVGMVLRPSRIYIGTTVVVVYGTEIDQLKKFKKSKEKLIVF